MAGRPAHLKTAAIIGLGRIGAGNAGLAGDVPLSHLAAILATPRLKLTALVDPDEAVRRRINVHSPGLADVAVVASTDALREGADVVAICTPPETHAAVLDQALEMSPRVIVCEKPLAADTDVARDMVAKAERAGVALRVNFNRRFNPLHGKWRAKATTVPRAVVVRYGKGLWNYASHAVDLLLDWYGPVDAVVGFAAGIPSKDPNVSFVCRMAAGFDAVFVGIDGAAYDQLEIDVFNADGRLEMRGGGAEMVDHRPVPDLYYRGYTHLADGANKSERAPVGGFAELYAAVATYLHEQTPLPGCDGASALGNMAVLNAAMRSLAQGGMPVRPEGLGPAEPVRRARFELRQK